MQQQLDGVRPAECVGWTKRLDNDVERFSGRCRFRDVIANLLQDFASIRWIKPAIFQASIGTLVVSPFGRSSSRLRPWTR